MKQARQTRPTRGESRRKKLRRKRAAQALAAGAAIAGGTQAYAVPVRFDNPPGAGHFVWTAAAGQDVLDALNDASSQPGVAQTPGNFIKSLDGYGAGEGIGGGLPAANQLQGRSLGGYSFLEGVAAGVAIPTLGTGLTFRGAGYSYTTYPYAYYYAGVRTLLPEGVPTYLGIKFDQGAGDQYGWIGVVRTGQTTDAFAWGYETDPGVPIGAGVPEPGTLAMLAVGAAAMAGRRRRPAV